MSVALVGTDRRAVRTLTREARRARKCQSGSDSRPTNKL